MKLPKFTDYFSSTAQKAVPVAWELKDTKAGTIAYTTHKERANYCRGISGFVVTPLFEQHQPQPSVSVSEAGYNDVIHALLKQHETEMRSKGRNPIDYTTKWSLAADAVAALRALKGGDHG